MHTSFSLMFTLKNGITLLNFIPRNKEQMPLDKVGFFSYITFSWVGRYMKQAYRYGLQPEDVPLCSTKDGCDHCAQRYILTQQII